VDRATRIASQLLTMARIEPHRPIDTHRGSDRTGARRARRTGTAGHGKGRRLISRQRPPLPGRHRPGSPRHRLAEPGDQRLNFAPPGSEVRVQVQPQAGGAVYISVEDAGPVSTSRNTHDCSSVSTAMATTMAPGWGWRSCR
jgi:two-component system sensor histidine kinase QseC